MGAFFLFKHDSNIDEEAVRRIFVKKGFAAPQVFALTSMRLWLFRKQLVEEDNFVFNESGDAVFATGTPIYKGKGYRQGLELLLSDYCHGKLDQDEMLGSFCLIFYVGSRISILTDRLNLQHVFLDDAGERISSSFLAVLVAHTKKLALNRLALYEKLATGYIVGPDTLVAGIRQVTDRLMETAAGDCFRFIAHKPRPGAVDFCKSGFAACVDEQIEVLKRYFEKITTLALQYGPELGLSSGYDSRLVFCLSQFLPVPLAVHTHSTGMSHNLDRAIVERMVQAKGCPLSIVRTLPIQEQSEQQLADILTDGLYYYDGRNSHNMGAFSQTYTRAYKLKTLGPYRLSLNGLGGEIYRNYYLSSRKRCGFRQWMENHVYYGPYTFLNRKLLEEVHENSVAKMMHVLGADLRGSVDQLTLRRYYSEVRMPDCDGINNNAHNQVAFYLTPFIEHSIISTGYRATPYIGRSGEFQAAMISRLDREIAAMPSHYGFPLTQEPLRHKCLAAVKGYVPDRFWNLRRKFRLKALHLEQNRYEAHAAMVKRSRVLQEIEEALRHYAPEVDLPMTMRDYAQRPTMVFIGSFFREFYNNIRQ